MKRQTIGLVVAVILALGIASVASAEGPVVSVKVPFAFTVGSTELPAGAYEISLGGADNTRLSLRGPRGMMLMSYTTRLAALKSTTSQVVFDKANEKYYLSEVHVPGMDGFAFKGAPGTHTHETINGN